MNKWDLYEKLRSFLLFIVLDIIIIGVFADWVTGVRGVPGNDLFIGLFLVMLIAGFAALGVLLFGLGVHFFTLVIPEEHEQKRKRRSQERRRR